MSVFAQSPVFALDVRTDDHKSRMTSYIQSTVALLPHFKDSSFSLFLCGFYSPRQVGEFFHEGQGEGFVKQDIC